MQEYDGKKLLQEVKKKNILGNIQYYDSVWHHIGELFITDQDLYVFHKGRISNPFSPNVDHEGVRIPLLEVKTISVEQHLLRIFFTPRGLKQYEDFHKCQKYVAFNKMALKFYEKLNSVDLVVRDLNKAKEIQEIIKAKKSDLKLKISRDKPVRVELSNKSIAIKMNEKDMSALTKSTKQPSTSTYSKEDSHKDYSWLNSIPKSLSPPERKILLFLYYNAPGHRATIQEIIKKTELDYKTVNKYVKILKKADIIDEKEIIGKPDSERKRYEYIFSP
jgi:hypothetical protein